MTIVYFGMNKIVVVINDIQYVAHKEDFMRVDTYPWWTNMLPPALDEWAHR